MCGIEVRFKNNGLESIEVQDNGMGISSENYETIGIPTLQNGKGDTYLLQHSSTILRSSRATMTSPP